MAECLFKAEVASMGDKPLEVGVGQQVLRKFLVRKYPNKITNEKDLSENIQKYFQKILRKYLTEYILKLLCTCWGRKLLRSTLAGFPGKECCVVENFDC